MTEAMTTPIPVGELVEALTALAADESDGAARYHIRAAADALTAQAKELEARAAREAALVAALKPFAECAQQDIGQSEDDADTFRNTEYNRAPKITVGDIRRASAALSQLSKIIGELPATRTDTHPATANGRAGDQNGDGGEV